MKNKHNETTDAEYYFIQLLFCSGRELLRSENRKLYDVMLEKYKEIYSEGRQLEVDLKLINDKFFAILGL